MVEIHGILVSGIPRQRSRRCSARRIRHRYRNQNGRVRKLLRLRVRPAGRYRQQAHWNIFRLYRPQRKREATSRLIHGLRPQVPVENRGEGRNPMVAAFSYTLRNIRSLPSGSSAAESQYLKLLPPMNSRSIEVGGISADDIFRKLSRNFSSLLASPYSGTSFYLRRHRSFCSKTTATVSCLGLPDTPKAAEIYFRRLRLKKTEAIRYR